MSYPVQTMNITQELHFTASPKDSAGLPLTPDGPMSLSVSPLGIVAPGAVGGNYFVVAKSLGTATVTVTGTFSGTPLSESFQVTVTPNPPVTLGLVFQTPISQ